jgi:hypothetical protein
MGVPYCTREDVSSAPDIKFSARNSAQVDRAIESASRSIEGLLHRKLYPVIATRYFDWPPPAYGRPWRLWLDEDELISVTSLVAGGTTIAASDYFLEPANSGPPYNRIEIDLASTASFSSGSTHQRSIAVTGVWGHSDESAAAGALAEALDNSETEVNVTNAALIGVGDLIKCETERMLVTNKTMLDTGQNASALTAAKADVSITGVTAGTVHSGEVIAIDSERMLVVDVTGTTLTVNRGWDGTALASHSLNADIYALRTLTVTRGALGTTAATHSDATALTRWVPPGLVRSLCIAESVNEILQGQSGYARTVGSDDQARETTGRGLADLRKRTYNAYGRKARTRAV